MAGSNIDLYERGPQVLLGAGALPRTPQASRFGHDNLELPFATDNTGAMLLSVQGR